MYQRRVSPNRQIVPAWQHCPRIDSQMSSLKKRGGHRIFHTLCHDVISVIFSSRIVSDMIPQA
jgi:hypothetical protein